MVEVKKIMLTSSKGPMHALPHSVTQTLQQATADPHLHQRLTWHFTKEETQTAGNQNKLLKFIRNQENKTSLHTYYFG